MKGKGIIFCAVLIGVIFLCASAVSAASTNPTGTMITAQKTVGDTQVKTNTSNTTLSTTSKKTVGYLRTYKVYYLNKNKQTRWYRCTVYYISSKNVYTNYAHSTGRGAYMQFRKIPNSVRWWETDMGNLWTAMGWKTGTRPLYSTYNSWTASNWITWMDNYNKYTLVRAFRNSYL